MSDLLFFFNQLLFGPVPMEGGLGLSAGSFRAYVIVFLSFITLFFVSKIIKRDVISDNIYKFFLILAAIIGTSAFQEVTEFLINPSHQPYRFDLALIQLLFLALWFICHISATGLIDKRGLKYGVWVFAGLTVLLCLGSVLAFRNNYDLFSTYFSRMNR